MLVRDVMSKNIDYLGPKSTLRDVAHEMSNHDFGFVPLRANKKIVGVVTDRDLCIRAFARGLDANTKVEQVMTKKVLYCHDKDDIKKAAKIMENNQIRRLLVLDNKEELIGVVSLGDIACLSNDHHLNAEILEAISEKH